MSALPGLVRLVAADVDDLMSPVYVQQVTIDPSRGQVFKTDGGFDDATRSGADRSTSGIVTATASDLSVDQNDEVIPAAKILRGRPNDLNSG